METTTTMATVMSAVRESARPWRGANTAHAGTFGPAQGWTVPNARFLGRDVLVAGLRTTGVDAIAPITGVAYPHPEEPPV